jgi:hypothetical protein
LAKLGRNPFGNIPLIPGGINYASLKIKIPGTGFFVTLSNQKLNHILIKGFNEQNHITRVLI